MTYPKEDKKEGSLEMLRVDCSKCFGLCCIALYFSASEGFPNNKEAGKPCINLKPDFSCSVHGSLRKKGLKGCTSYDCFGAGQRVAQVTYGGRDWRQAPGTAKQMFEVFLIMRQLHEMLWYLEEAHSLELGNPLQDSLDSLLKDTEKLTLLSPDDLLGLDVAAHRARVAPLLSQASELVRSMVKKGSSTSSRSLKPLPNRSDFFGADLRKTDLRGANLRGACLIAANLAGDDLKGADFIGADMRDADLRGADLSGSIFLTQAQINTARGNSDTKLPKSLARPSHWVE